MVDLDHVNAAEHQQQILTLLQRLKSKHYIETDHLSKNRTPYTSDSQPGCRGTLGCRKEVSGVPPSFELLPIY